jgi:hypothetical protein
VTIDPFLLFLAVATAWFTLRVVVRGWSARKLASGELSVQGWALANAGSWALMPLLAIPFTHADNRWLLVLVAAALFIFQTAVLLLVQRYVERG